MRRTFVCLALLFTCFCCCSTFGQSSLTGPVSVNNVQALNTQVINAPATGTYVIAAGGRLHGEYILSVEGYYATQTVHLLVEANQYDNGATIQVLDNHSYQGATILNNFRILLPNGNAFAAYLVVDVVGGIQPNGSSNISIQYQGSAGYDSGLASAGSAVPSNTSVASSIAFALNESNVGLGTASAGERLEVNGNIKLSANSGGSVIFPDGTVQATAWNGVLSGGDYAESVNVSGDREEYEPGDVIVIDPASEGKFLKSSTPYSTGVTGIYSTKPGVVGRRQHTAREHMKEEVPMAMTGIVPTKVSAENGPIKPGDLLVSSSKPGYAMKGTDRSQMLGAVIGKAIGHLDSGTGIIEAVVTLQ